MKKPSLTFFLAFIAVVCMKAQTFTVDNLKYTVIDAAAGTVELTTYRANKPTGALNVPATVTYGDVDYRVTAIGKDAFWKCDQITELSIPATVTDIGNVAFSQCTALAKVTLPEGLTSIGAMAFADCTALERIVIPESVTSIKFEAFSSCSSLVEINIPQNVTSISTGMFSYCTSLRQIELHDRVTAIGNKAFFKCKSLTAILLPASLTSIGEEAFASCPLLSEINVADGNTVFSSADGVLFDKAATTLLQYPSGKEDAVYAIPASVTSIGVAAFMSCGNLTQLDMHDGVTEIGKGAFSSCENLKRADLPAGITVISPNMFSYCESLEKAVIPEGVTTIGEYAYEGCNSLRHLEIPATVERIGGYAFYKSSYIKDITVRANVPPVIGYFAFPDYCYKIPVFVPADAIEAYRTAEGWKQFNYFGEWNPDAFNVNGLRYLITDRTKNTVDLMGFSASDSYYLSVDDSVNYDGTEYTVTGISDNAFKDCTTLSMLFFGKNLLRIGNNAFDGCTRVSEMTANSLMPPSVGTDGFKGISRDIPLHTPVESVMYYQMNAPWNEFTNLQGNPFFVDGLEYIIVDHDMQTVSMISDTKLPQILDIPDVITYKGTDYTVVSIRDGAISDSYGITEIYVPNTVTYIGDKVCGYSPDLRILFLGSGLETIGATAFEYCQNIAEITSLASVPPVLGNYVFGEVKRTTPVYVPANAIEAYRAADIWKEFNLMPYQPSSFSSANMRCLVTGTDSDTGTVELSGYDSEPEGAVEIPESIDYYGTDYTVTAIGEGAYEGCSELTEVSIPASVTTIGNHAFSNCSALTNVTIGNDVVNARNNMPAGSAVSGADSGNALIHIGDGAFARCSALAQMTVTAVVPPTVGTDAFDEVSRSIPVYVPENALADYRAAEVWKEFTNLKPYTTSSVSTLVMPESIRVCGGMLHNPEGHHFIIYDLTGRIIYSGNATTLSLTPGIYVVSCNGANGKAVF